MLTETKRKYLKKSPPWESDSSKCEPSHDSGIVNADRGGAYFMTYIEQIKSPKWQKRRLEILERDKFTCRICGDKDSELHVHHIFYKKNSKIWEYPDHFLITLCSDCHDSLHDAYIDAQIMTTLFIEDYGFESFKKYVLFFQSFTNKK